MVKELTLSELVALAKHRLDVLEGSPYITKTVIECIDELDEVVNEIKDIKINRKYTILAIKEHGWSPEEKY